jgi:6,7-dimethyl-8-ribityllumazine synthase
LKSHWWPNELLGPHDANICLGAVIRGNPTFRLQNEVTKGIAQLNLELAILIAYGIITAIIPDRHERAGKNGQ